MVQYTHHDHKEKPQPLNQFGIPQMAESRYRVILNFEPEILN